MLRGVRATIDNEMLDPANRIDEPDRQHDPRWQKRQVGMTELLAASAMHPGVPDWILLDMMGADVDAPDEE